MAGKQEKDKPPKPPKPKDLRVWYITNNYAVLLFPNTELIMATLLPIDQIDTITLEIVDSAGNVIPGSFDSPPVWTNSNPAAATDVVSADGTSNVLTPVAGAIGQSTTIGVTGIVGGKTFTTSNDYTITAGAAAGIRMVDTFSGVAVRVVSP